MDLKARLLDLLSWFILKKESAFLWTFMVQNHFCEKIEAAIFLLWADWMPHIRGSLEASQTGRKAAAIRWSRHRIEKAKQIEQQHVPELAQNKTEIAQINIRY